ncbi:DUF4038 domain-containing protein [Kineococcus rhizosphaerae]|uniref:Uncharacterized protein DUF4038 n=1 Tax=Kineococcus rhizosphaerae TaxID=559628 RepID=A0A2T0R8S2_9ACTN|nr:DUF4038 domain-containing protein [Kineococcus rhizosphaerae]PRY17562.1 uncharacterized protein DUF4038 [Kineococcus rhizosphaerae]
MTRWTIAPDARTLLAGGRPSFLLADTVWAAFTSCTEREWDDHTELRRRQGFNAVLVSVLPIAHDRSDTASRSPYRLTGHGPDLDGGDGDYWTRASAMLGLARERGLTPLPVVLWNNFVPGTWGARATPGLVLDAERTLDLVARCVEAFAEHEPVWVVSGDDSFADSAEGTVALERYALAARELRRLDPGSLLTWHHTPTARMPAELADGPLVDLHGVQSGHDEAWASAPLELARHYRAMAVPRPVVNLEPCYEGLGWGGRSRHRREEVRRASWTGVVAGAAAGLGYGAHGVWSWHRRGAGFTAQDVHGLPFPASVAAQFEGALDAAFVREVVEAEGLLDLAEAPGLLHPEPSGALAGRTPGGVVAVYVPHPFAVRLRDVPGQAQVTTYDLARRRAEPGRLVGTGGDRWLEQPEFLGDALHVVRFR